MNNMNINDEKFVGKRSCRVGNLQNSEKLNSENMAKTIENKVVPGSKNITPANNSAAAVEDINDEMDQTEQKIKGPVFAVYGLPFLGTGKTVVLNERAVAIKCSTMHTVRYDAALKCYERYPCRGGDESGHPHRHQH
jgi:hypothetical protein